MADTTSLERLDPADAWRPWEPDTKTPFDLKWAGHLYRRATFGATYDQLRESVKLGLPKTLDRLMNGEEGHEDRREFLERSGELIARKDNANQLRGWWLYAMLHSMYPLREKMVLFWHNHFATSIAKVERSRLMLQQNVAMRKHALGKFGPFLLAMSKDPAMLIYLDSNSNVKGKPNENYAREVMELFSLGVGNYTEKDVQEAARAFTGWHTDGEAYTFNEKQHDDGQKTVLKQSGKWNGDDIVRILLEQPVCARFIVRKLYAAFVSEAKTPPEALIEPLAEQLRKNGYDIKAVVRTMLSSRHFYSAFAYRQRIKSPVEFTMGAALAISDGKFPQSGLIKPLETMGQSIFAPPNVKGWPGGGSWLNTSTVLVRHNFVHGVAASGVRADDRVGRNLSRSEEILEEYRLREEEAREQQLEAQRQAEEARLKAEGKPVPPRPARVEPELPAPAANMDIAALVQREKVDTPEAIVKVLVDVLLQGDLRDSARTKLVEFVKKDNPKDAALRRRIREAAHLIMALAEYQLS